jgi:hypothetical protein
LAFERGREITFKDFANITFWGNAMCVGLDLQGHFKLLWKFNHHGRFPFCMTNCSEFLGAVKQRRQAPIRLFRLPRAGSAYSFSSSAVRRSMNFVTSTIIFLSDLVQAVLKRR